MEEAETNGEWRRSLEMVERRADGYRDGDGNAWAVFWDPNLGLLLGLGLADDLGRGSDEGEGDGGIEGALNGIRYSSGRLPAFRPATGSLASLHHVPVLLFRLFPNRVMPAVAVTGEWPTWLPGLEFAGE